MNFDNNIRVKMNKSTHRFVCCSIIFLKFTKLLLKEFTAATRNILARNFSH